MNSREALNKSDSAALRRVAATRRADGGRGPRSAALVVNDVTASPPPRAADLGTQAQSAPRVRLVQSFPKVLILIGGHLATAPRPQKEAAALRAAGVDVVMRGVWFDETLAAEDADLARRIGIDFAPALDLRPGSDGRFSSRIHQRIARELFTRLGVTTPRAFGLGGPELLQEARRIRPGLTIVHSEAGLWVARKLESEGNRVAADFEDWFSHDLPLSERTGRPVAALEKIERDILRRAPLCMTTTRALALALAKDSGAERVPLFVPNAFPAADRAAAMKGKRDERDRQAVSFHWFSQTVGPGRGLETLAQALPRLRGQWQLSLRGSLRGHTAWFERTFPSNLRDRVRLLEPVRNDELLSRTMSHDVGLALEEPYCPSKDLTAANKLFESMRAGLAVVATRTKGQEEILDASPGAGVLVRPADPEDLARAMQSLIDDRDLLRKMRERAVEAAETTWAWERHAPALVEAVRRAIG
jgi:glycosyltransferase involved in cell wall biosynthesis